METTHIRKYELIDTDTVTTCDGRTLKRIRALVAIAELSVAPGDLGGYVESESVLSHEGNAWVSGDARVYGNAQVSGNAWVSSNARVSGDARVYGNAQVYSNAQVYGDARVSPIHIQSLTWNVTICDQVMTIGCQSHKLSDWESFDDARIASMDGRNALRFWRDHKSLLLGLARANGREFSSVEQEVK